MAVVAGGSKMNLVCGLSNGGDYNQNYGKHRYLAQTFTLDAEHVVWRCRFMSYTLQAGEFYHYALRQTDGAGVPASEDIYHTTLSPMAEVGYSPGKWRRFDFNEFPVLPAGVYALVASVPTADTDWVYKLRADSTAPPYAQGKAWISEDDGNTWEELPGMDFLFEVWGYQRPPDPPPPPVIGNWAVLDLEQIYQWEGYDIKITTDNMCHLYLRYSWTPPLTHPLTEVRRGLSIQTGTRYCFVNFKETEQEEPGDTTIHYFHIIDFPVCSTLWYYFIGTKQAEEMPSSSPIFSKHKPPLTTKYIICESDNRTINRTWGTWVGTHDRADGVIQTFHNAPWFRVVVETTLTVSYHINRAYLRYDTSEIPPGAQLFGAKIWIFVNNFNTEQAPEHDALYITQGVQHVPPIPTDYGDQLPYTTVLGQAPLADLIIGQYNAIPLNQDGLDFINTGGITKFCLRHLLDVIDEAPGLSSNFAWFRSYQMGNGYRPYLEVNYLPE